MNNNLSPRKAARLIAAKRFAEKRFRHRITRDQVAREVNMDPAAFSRFFRETTGMRFVDYIATLRVQEAARLLNAGRSDSMLEIARKSGFRNQSVFNQQFKRRLGTTPRAFKQNVDIEPITP